jgi:hypothetical protein
MPGSRNDGRSDVGATADRQDSSTLVSETAPPDMLRLELVHGSAAADAVRGRQRRDTATQVRRPRVRLAR